MGKKVQNIIKANKPFSLCAFYAGCGMYEVVFAYQEIRLYQPLSDEPYREYRKLCYLYPVRAKNYLLDFINFDGTPYKRSDFYFIGEDNEPTREIITLWQEIEKGL